MIDLQVENEKLRAALRAFTELEWFPDAAPGPSCYMVSPVPMARQALQQAGILLDGKSPFPSDNNGSVYTVTWDGVPKRSVWLDGMAYGEDQRDLVPEKHRATFDAALAT